MKNIDAQFLINTGKRFWSKVDIRDPEECWEWKAYKNKRGYGSFSFRKVPRLAHRIAWMIHYKSEISEDMCVCHSCDNPTCCNPSHLFLGTQADNVKDMAQKGRLKGGFTFLSGEKNPNVKHSDKQIKKIRDLYATGRYTQKELAIKFESDRTYINRIINFNVR